MEGEVYIRVVDTDDNGEYDYRGKMSNAEWSAIMCQHIYEAERCVDPWTQKVEWFQRMMDSARSDEERRYIANRYGGMLRMHKDTSERGGMVQDYREGKVVYDDGSDSHAKEVRCRCVVTDCDENEVDVSFFDNHSGERDAFLLCLNVLPTEEDIAMRREFDEILNSGKAAMSEGMRVPWEDAESELKFWLDDSSKIIDDKDLDDGGKIRALPSRPLVFGVGGSHYCVPDCRILEIRKEAGSPYKFVVLGNTIAKIQ